MTKSVQDDKPPRDAETEAWFNEEVAAQETRYASIVKEIDAMTPQREKWYEEFLEIIQTKGFNWDGDNRVPIKKEDIPTKPDRPDAMRVIW